MAVATYGSGDARSPFATRGTALHRPFQVFVMAADHFLILICYAAASGFYSAAIASVSDGASVGAGLIVGVLFVSIAYFQGVYDTDRLLRLAWQLRKTVVIWAASLTILAVSAFLLKSTDNLSRGTVIIFTAVGGVGLMSLRFAWQLALGSNFARGRLVDRKVVLLSLKPLDFTSNRFKDLRKNGFDVVRHFVIGADGTEAGWEQQIRDVIRQSRAADVDEYLLDAVMGPAPSKGHDGGCPPIDDETGSRLESAPSI